MRVPPVYAPSCLAVAVLICLTLFSPPVFAASSDQAAADSALGPQWKHLARGAGIIFAGTVLSSGSQPADCEPDSPLVEASSPKSAPRRIQSRDGACPVSRAIPAVNLRFRVDRPIAGVLPGQVLTIREWTGALSRQRPLHPGDRVLLFLYPPSRLGLTSPVGGQDGQVRLDPTGLHVAGARYPLQNGPSSPRPIPVSQLERAIRAARGE